MDSTAPRDTTVDLGRSGEALLRLAADRRHLRMDLDIPCEGLDKSGVNGLIAALVDVRDTMFR